MVEHPNKNFTSYKETHRWKVGMNKSVHHHWSPWKQKLALAKMTEHCSNISIDKTEYISNT